ncbi:Hypothetical protein CINCED_3A024377 [Cinara cedri]|uniref:Uncharacterized protein n=1 Tax=Cinara cedri TaxID=506608 RepID=A0A5E4N5C1_9HEMI|nr:Hypothetical protein CINCED_3A024377 [Cinara cedri]
MIHTDNDIVTKTQRNCKWRKGDTWRSAPNQLDDWTVPQTSRIRSYSTQRSERLRLGV